MSNTFAVPCHETSVHTPRLLEISSIFNLRPSDPGQATSPVWVLEKEGLDSQPQVLKLQCDILWERWLILQGSLLPQDPETLGAGTALIPFLPSPTPRRLGDSPG